MVCGTCFHCTMGINESLLSQSLWSAAIHALDQMVRTGGMKSGQSRFHREDRGRDWGIGT